MATHLTAERMWAIPRVGTPVVTGDVVITTVTTYPTEPGKGTTRIWRVPLDGSPPVPLTSERHSATKPAVSPDGTKLAFLRVIEDRPQVHVMPLDGGEPEAVTDMPLGVIGMRWFPDSSRLLVLAELFAEAPTPDGTAELRDARAEQPHSSKTTEVAVFRYWDRWLTEGRYPHLFVVTPGEPPTDLTPDSARWMRWDNTGDPTEDVAISPDGSQIAACFEVSTPPHRDLRWSLFTYDVDGGTEVELTPEATGHVSAPRYSPDGRFLVWGETTDRHFYADRNRLIRMDRASGERIELADAWDRSPASWEVDDSGILLVAEHDGRQPVFTLDIDGGMPEEIGDGGTLAAPARLPDGRVVATRNSIVSPPELVVIEGDKVNRLTHFTAEALEGVELPEVTEIRFQGGRDDEIQAWLVRPKAIATPAPLVQMIHGGPHGTFGDTWHWRWNAAAFCGSSRIAVLVNFHGSTGFGQEFAECIRGEWGDLPAADIEAATDHLVEQGVADPERMAVTGGSYGGYMVAWLTSQTNRYRCAIAHAAVTNLPGMYASDVTSGRAYSYGAEVWEDLERVNRWSPAAHAAGYATPTLVIHGEQDYRVPITQGLELYGVLQAKGIPSRLVYYPDENHWILSQGNSIHWYGEVTGWLERHLG
ncbi:MAG: S9 family peptidase [Acidimicrobiia bacterium]|nr:S9 family peptidase [Acidimicrobiia bacterium]